MVIVLVVVVLLALVVAYDLVQRRHAILRNFPIIGHFRYLLEAVGPELRQYIVTGNNEERPFTRDQRRWVYASAKKQNNYFGFGTDEELELSPNFLIIKHSVFPHRGGAPAFGAPDSAYPLPSAKVLGSFRKRRGAFRPSSVVNVSGMSYGSLSGRAVEAMNRGCALADCLHNTGEGGISEYHRHGGQLVWQIGTGYFGCRDEKGGFSLDRFVERVEADAVRAVEIKLSQGAKPGLGGVLPAAKVTRRIAAARGVRPGVDCVSPPHHSEFDDVDSLLDFVELLADRTGVPIGVKSAVGEDRFWDRLARLMESGDRGVDFITVDGGEGGTGAAPLVFSDHVALPFKLAFSRVYRTFARHGVHERVTFVGSGKLGFPEAAILAFALGCDLIAVGREAMMAIGCIQAQRCHTSHCPTGVATQNRWLMRGLDPESKAARLANYVTTLRKELTLLSQACGVAHPGLVTGEHIEILDDRFGSASLYEVFGYQPGWGLPLAGEVREIERIMGGGASAARPPGSGGSSR